MALCPIAGSTAHTEVPAELPASGLRGPGETPRPGATD